MKLGKFTNSSDIHYLSCGRELGAFSEGSNDLHFLVGSAKNVKSMDRKHFLFWSELKHHKSSREWVQSVLNEQDDMDEKVVKKQFTKLLKSSFLIDQKYLTNESREIHDFIVSRNGIGKGKTKENKWIISDPMGEEFIGLSKTEFLVWSTANGIRSIKEIVFEIKGLFSCNLEQALVYFKMEAYKLVRAGLWVIEYFPNIRKQVKKVFNREGQNIESLNQMKHSRIVPIGHSIGDIGNHQSEKNLISIGSETLSLTRNQYILWLASKDPYKNLIDLYDLFKIPFKNYLAEIVFPLIKKNAIILWELDTIKNSHIRILQQGKSLFAKQNQEIMMQSFSINNKKSIPLAIYLLWMNVGPIYEMKDIISNYKESTGCNENEAWECILEFVPILNSYNLVTLDFLDNWEE